MNSYRLLATALAAVMVCTALAPMGAAAATTVDGDLTVSVSEDRVVTVAANETVENATVNVTVDDENASYEGAGEYTTDENGTVALEAPSGNESVNVTVTATVDNATAQTTATLEPTEDAEEEENFGSLVSAFVENAKNSSDTDGPLGQLVASFVVDNNPGNAPDHAGPPGEDDKKNGGGQPEHAGGPSDDEKGNGSGNGGGPPANAGK